MLLAVYVTPRLRMFISHIILDYIYFTCCCTSYAIENAGSSRRRRLLGAGGLSLATRLWGVSSFISLLSPVVTALLRIYSGLVDKGVFGC